MLGDTTSYVMLSSFSVSDVVSTVMLSVIMLSAVLPSVLAFFFKLLINYL
jgi:hypothetical protein